jgi:hypothetical protein
MPHSERRTRLPGRPGSLVIPRGSHLVAGPRHVAPGLLSNLRNPQLERSRHVNENDHPKGALLFMLVYLALLAFMWTNLYLKLWTR